MADNVKVKVEETNKKTIEFDGRLIGFIENDEECKAILNTKDAARKIFTAESVKTYDRPTTITNKRFVIVTKELSEGEPHVFISPKIESLSFSIAGGCTLKCKGDISYTLVNI